MPVSQFILLAAYAVCRAQGNNFGMKAAFMICREDLSLVRPPARHKPLSTHRVGMPAATTASRDA